MSILPQAIRSESELQTNDLAAGLARELKPGDVVLLSGDLGSGKTTFVRAACKELGVTQPVTSPTFTIGAVYKGKHEIAHLDMYRLAGASDDIAELLADYATADRITFIEWPDAVQLLGVAPAARVTLDHAGGDTRKISIERG